MFHLSPLLSENISILRLINYVIYSKAFILEAINLHFLIWLYLGDIMALKLQLITDYYICSYIIVVVALWLGSVS